MENPYEEAVESLSDRRFDALDTYFSGVDEALNGLYEEDDTKNSWVSREDVREYVTDRRMVLDVRDISTALDALADIGAVPSVGGDKYCAWTYSEEVDTAAVRKAIRDRNADGSDTDDVLSAAEELRQMDAIEE